jgi:hypothetical protein
MWKVDPKDKFIHDDINEYTRTNIYIWEREHICNSGTIWEDWRMVEEEKSMIANNI